MAEKVTRAARAARGVLFVHSSPRALCPHVEWAAGARARRRRELRLGRAARAPRHSCAPSSTGRASAGSGAKLASALRGWEQLRFEVSEDPSPAPTVPDGCTRPISASSSPRPTPPATRSSPRIASAMRWRSPGHDALELHRELRLALGQAWDDELEPFRHASDFARSSGCTRWAERRRGPRGGVTRGRRTLPGGASRRNPRTMTRRPRRLTATGVFSMERAPSGIRSDAAERDDGVVAAEAERVADREQLAVAERARRGDHVERDLGVLLGRG